MNNMSTKTRALTEGAVMVALATVLSMIEVYKSPQGGGVTAASMVPIILISLRWPAPFALLTAVVYSCMQMLVGFYPPPTPDFLSFAAVVLLDYVFAFGVLGLAGPISRRFKNARAGILTGTVAAVSARFVCHFLSGVLIWKVYAGDQAAAVYSLIYNGSYMLPELIVTTVFVFILCGGSGSFGRFQVKPADNND